ADRQLVDRRARVEAPTGAPVVLPEVPPEAGLTAPVDGGGVGVHAELHPRAVELGAPALKVRADLVVELPPGGVVVDRDVHRHAGRPAGLAVDPDPDRGVAVAARGAFPPVGG